MLFLQHEILHENLQIVVLRNNYVLKSPIQNSSNLGRLKKSVEKEMQGQQWIHPDVEGGKVAMKEHCMAVTHTAAV